MPIIRTMLTEGTAGLDSGLVESAIGLVKSVMGLFGEYPLNLILIFSLAGVAFGLFRKAKKAAK